MTCPKCNNEMTIDEWNGWVWVCVNCGYEGHKATDEEIEEYEDDCYVPGEKE